jgi:hypothetical protein
VAVLRRRTDVANLLSYESILAFLESQHQQGRLLEIEKDRVAIATMLSDRADHERTKAVHSVLDEALNQGDGTYKP